MFILLVHIAIPLIPTTFFFDFPDVKHKMCHFCPFWCVQDYHLAALIHLPLFPYSIDKRPSHFPAINAITPNPIPFMVLLLFLVLLLALLPLLLQLLFLLLIMGLPSRRITTWQSYLLYLIDTGLFARSAFIFWSQKPDSRTLGL